VEYSFILTYEQFSHTFFSELKLKKQVSINTMNFEVKFMTRVEISNDNNNQHNIQCGNLFGYTSIQKINFIQTPLLYTKEKDSGNGTSDKFINHLTSLFKHYTSNCKLTA
jgi:hypothetical protein